MESGKINKPHGIIVFGLNGSGKTTLGRELARILNFKHIDHEEYAFHKSEIPYTNARSRDDCINLMLADIKKYGSFVISAVTGDFGSEIVPMYKFGVYITAPLEIRVKRVDLRDYDKFGERVHKGGDMYEQRLKFRDFVASRSSMPVEQWAETLTCPVICVDGAADWRINAANTAKRFLDLVDIAK